MPEFRSSVNWRRRAVATVVSLDGLGPFKDRADVLLMFCNVLCGKSKEFVPATEVLANWCRRVHPQVSLDEFPSLFEVLLWTGQFEVVDVNGKNKLKLSVEKATFPDRKGLKAGFRELGPAVLLPIHTGKRVTVKCKS